MDISTLLPAGQVLALWGEAADRLLTQDHGDAALLYLHLLRHNNPFPPHWDIGRIRHSQGVLLSMGLLPPQFQGELQLPSHVPKEVSVIPPDYTTEDLNTVMAEDGGEFRALVESVQGQFGKTLTTVDVKMLLEIYSHLELPVEVILMVVTTCIRRQELAKTSRRLPSMKDVKKEACFWQNRGIITLESAMSYTEELSKMNHQQGTIAQIFHLDRNHFTTQERDYIKQWNQWGFPMESYPLAYERCLMGEKDGRFKWAYVNGIFKKWHERNLHTPQEILAGDSQYSQIKRPDQGYKVAPKGPYAHDTLQASETQAPSPQETERMQAEFQAMKNMLGGTTPPTQ